MRISSIRPQAIRQKNVSFGYFYDRNALRTLKEFSGPRTKKTDRYTGVVIKEMIKDFRNCEYLNVYTDPGDKKIKARFDKKQMTEYLEYAKLSTDFLDTIDNSQYNDLASIDAIKRLHKKYLQTEEVIRPIIKQQQAEKEEERRKAEEERRQKEYEHDWWVYTHLSQ